jgi:hypothetical protein
MKKINVSVPAVPARFVERNPRWGRRYVATEDDIVAARAAALEINCTRCGVPREQIEWLPHTFDVLPCKCGKGTT